MEALHFYFGINYRVVWAVVKKELPAIEPAIAKILIFFLHPHSE